MGKFLNSPRGNTLQLMAGAVMISFSAVFVKLAHVGPTASGFYRTLFGGLVLCLILLLKRERPFQGMRPFGLALACGLLFALDLTFWHRSVLLVGPGLGTILSNFEVFFLAAWGGWVLGERVGARLLAAIILAMIGLSLLVGLHQGWPDQAMQSGVLLGLLTAVCYASYILTLRRLQSMARRPSAMASLAVISLACALIMGVEANLQGEGLAIPDTQSWLALLGYGVAGQVLGWVLISRGLPGTPASRAGLILLLQPTLAMIWDIVFFHRSSDWLELLGAGMALTAIYLGSRAKS